VDMCSHLGSHTLLRDLSGFSAYEFYTNQLKDAEGKISGPATVLAGLATGITESVLAVTPFESIKTQLYDTLTPAV